MKWISLSIGLLLNVLTFSQSDTHTQKVIDSLKQVIASDCHDTIKIAAYNAWDELIYIQYPDLDKDINQKIVDICNKQISQGKLTPQETKFYYLSKAGSINILGLILVDEGYYIEAQNLFLESLKIGEFFNDTITMAGPTNNLGMVYKNLNFIQKSLEYYQKAQLLDGKTDPWSNSIYLNNIGICYVELKKLSLAKKFYTESITLSNEIGNKQNEANSIGNLGQIYFMIEDYDSALVYFHQALDINREINNDGGVTYMLNQIGLANVKKQRYQEGLDFCMESFAILDSVKALSHEADCHQCLYLSNKGLGKTDKALHHLEVYRSLKDSLINQDKVGQILAEQYTYEFEKKRLQDSLEISTTQRIKEVELQRDIDRKQNQQFILYGGIVALLLIGGFIYRGYRHKKRDNEIIAEQKFLVEEKNQEITDSITYAKRIQEAILPDHQLISKHLPEHFIYYAPKDIVAGDFYWMDHFEGHTFFAVADCTGHGVPGAMVSVVCHNALNRSVREYKLKLPGEILDKTRELVINTFSKSSGNVKDGMDIAICVWNKENKRFYYAGANNSLYLINEGELTEIKADKQPIGIYDKATNFTSHEIKLQASSRIIAFTDGFADQFGGVDGKKYKYKNFKKFLISSSSGSLEKQKDSLEREFLQWKGQLEQLDDLCIIGVKI